MDQVLIDYFAAWNEADDDERRRRLERSLADGAELLDPTGRWQGVDGVSQRIANYHAAAPNTRVVPASGIDAHNTVQRYAWKIVAAGDETIMDGLDVAERDAAGRLRRIVMLIPSVRSWS